MKMTLQKLKGSHVNDLEERQPCWTCTREIRNACVDTETELASSVETGWPCI